MKIYNPSIDILIISLFKELCYPPRSFAEPSNEFNKSLNDDDGVQYGKKIR